MSRCRSRIVVRKWVGWHLRGSALGAPGSRAEERDLVYRQHHRYLALGARRWFGFQVRDKPLSSKSAARRNVYLTFVESMRYSLIQTGPLTSGAVCRNQPSAPPLVESQTKAILDGTVATRNAGNSWGRRKFESKRTVRLGLSKSLRG